MYIFIAIFVEVCRHWLTSFSLERSCGDSRRSVGIISAAFSTVGGEDSHKILIMGENLLQDLCGSCYNAW